MSIENPSSVPVLYKGLQPLTEDDSELLFGRNEERDRLVYSLQSSRLSILYGAREVGKTSLLRAGVANELRRKSENRSHSGPPDCAVILFNDWSKPSAVKNLSIAIDRELYRIGAARQKRPDFPDFIDCCKHWTKCLGEEGEEDGELFLLLDQFGDHLRNPSTRTEPGSFDFEFARVVSTRGLSVNFLIAIRDDLLANLDRYRSTIPGLYDNLIRLEALTRTQATQAIQGPVFVAYNSKHQDKKIGIEAKLVEAVLSSVRLGRDRNSREGFESEAVGDDRFDAGGLQLAMKAVWEWEIGHGSQTLRYETFERELGGITRITTCYLEERFRSFSARESNLSARVLDHLITPGGLGLAYQLSNLVTRAGATEEELKALTEKLHTQGMITAAGSVGSPRYEMRHRILTPAVINRVQNYFTERARQEKRLASEVERARGLFDETSQLDALQKIIKTSEEWSTLAESLLVSQDLKVPLRNTLEIIVSDLVQLGQLEGYKGAVSSIAYSKDGREIATGAEDGSVALWHIRCPGRSPLIYENGQTTWIWALRASFDGKWLATGSDDGTVVLWAVSDQGLKYDRLIVNSFSLVRGLSFSPDTSLLAIATNNGMVQLYGLREGNILHGFRASRHPVRCVEFSPDGLSLATGADDGVISLWDLKGNPLSRDEDFECAGFRHDAAVWGIKFHPSGERLASCSEDHYIKLWNLKLRREERTLIGHTSWVLGIQFNSDGSLLASGSEDGTARLWDQRGNQTAILVHGAPVNGICFSPDDLTLATAAADCKVRMWNVKPKQFTHPNKAILLDVSFGPDGKLLATGATDNEAQIWDEDGKIQRSLKGHCGWIMCVVFHPLKSHSLATASIDGTARLWNILDETFTEFNPGDGPVWSVAVSHDGQFLATGSRGGMICRWDLHEQNAAPLKMPSGHGSVWSVRFSPDGKLIAAGCQDGSILVGDFLARDVMQLTGVHGGQVLSLSFSSNGRFLASSSSEGRICLWDLTHKKYNWWHDLNAPVWSVSFSPNGEHFASGSVNRCVCLWNLESEKLCEYRATSPVRGLAFSRDRRWLAASCSDGTVRLWPALNEEFESLLIRAKDEWNNALKWTPNRTSSAVPLLE
jgi:WD40 repeat protein